MSSISESGYASLREMKRRINTTDSIVSSDEKCQDYMREADNHINVQIKLHAVTPIANPDPELVSLGSSLAAALYNYWQTPIKDRNLDAIKSFKKDIQDHVMTAYGKYNPNGLGGGTQFGKTRGFAP
jgi:hypothetical protein